MLQTAEDDQLKDMCPICPAPCPYPKCGKILRKNKFKQQIFEDLIIEKEIDIRKKVSAIYNKTEEDFPGDLQGYNRYLENIEDIIFKLSYSDDKQEIETVETELNKYEQEHKLEILERNMRESQRNDDLMKYKEARERLKQEKLKIQKQMELEDLEYQREQQQELLDKLTNSSTTSEELIKQQQNQMLKRSNLRRKQLQTINNQLDQQFNKINPFAKNNGVDSDDEQNGGGGGVNGSSKIPFTPFQGDRDLNKGYTIYYDPFINKLAKNKQYLGGGWRLQNVFQQALDEAFIGLGCNIELEKATTTT
ncbi:CDK-activating kinase assembly factor MAT1 family protein [Candida albicans]|uniref:CDK-activating kinase assembly factor MAT1 family protein n=1 Tax=Candida albicans TaxID=5476 RepID=A0A8H6F4L1_CANAX|nr:CDK-activating kinase assembly factor MAT1 family protein [Candida albicans]